MENLTFVEYKVSQNEEYVINMITKSVYDTMHTLKVEEIIKKVIDSHIRQKKQAK